MRVGELPVWQWARCPTRGCLGLGQGRFVLYFQRTTSERLTRRRVLGDFCTTTTYRPCWNGAGSEAACGRCSFSEESQSGCAVITSRFRKSTAGWCYLYLREKRVRLQAFRRITLLSVDHRIFT